MHQSSTTRADVDAIGTAPVVPLIDEKEKAMQKEGENAEIVER